MRHVALIIETSIAYGRGVLSGISQYNRRHGQWLTYFHPRGFGDPLPAWLHDWHGDGIIGGIGLALPADQLAGYGVPVVNLRARQDHRFPDVWVDNAQVARLAADHLIERGLKHFGFCGKGYRDNAWFDERCDAFTAYVQSRGFDCTTYTAPRDKPLGPGQMPGLQEWLAALPKPVGVMACNDVHGVSVLDACRRRGLNVPDEVAVVGVDNDQPLCELSIPSMSSVDVNPEQIGYESAALLDQMMNRSDLAQHHLRIAPRDVVTRRSSDMLASEDPKVNKAARYIRENACNGKLHVDAVLAHVSLSRPVLQARMKQVLGRTIHQEIIRVRIERARQLLLVPDIPIKEVAYKTGFSSVQHLTNVFRMMLSETPARFRAARGRVSLPNNSEDA